MGVKYVSNKRTKQQMPHFYQFYKNFIQNKERLTIKKAIEKLQIPVLIIHGNKDASVSIDEGKNLHKWNSKSEFKMVENSNHVFNTFHPWNKKELSKELKEVIETCIEFLK